MAFTHGKNAKFTVQDAGGTSRDISTYLTSAGTNRSADLAEASTFQTTYKQFVAGLIDAKIPIEGQFDPTVDGYLTGILQLARNFDYRPAGDGTGNISLTGSCILTSYEINTSLDGPATISGEFQVTGAITRTVL